MRIRSVQGRWWVVVATLSIGVSLGCQATPPPEPAGSEVDSAVSSFEPPADGRLTDDQVQMFLAVAKRSPRTGAEPLAGADGGELLVALEAQSQKHVEAARQLGYAADEYQWVQARIMEARLPADAGLGGLATGLNAVALETLEKQRNDAEDPEERARLEKQIAALEAQRGGDAAPARESIEAAARAHNHALLERHLGQEAASEAGP